MSDSLMSQAETGVPTVIPEGVILYRALAQRRRRVSPQAGRALEVLGHAIEYLTDEFLFEFDGASDAWRSGRVQAIQLMMATNRQIYFECPEVPRLKDRILQSWARFMRGL